MNETHPLALEHRIRAAAIVVQEERLLLVGHEDPSRGRVFWTPPGGAVEGTESLLQCAEREVWEETNLVISGERMVYIQELIVRDLSRRNLEVFVLSTVVGGALQALRHGPPYTHEARFFSQQDLQAVCVLPEILRETFWHDLRQDFPTVRYVGLRVI